MFYAVLGRYTFRNTARRDGVLGNIETRVVALTCWGTIAALFTSDSGDPGIMVEIRFATEAERDSFWNDAQAFVGSGVNGPLVGSWAIKSDWSAPDGPRLPRTDITTRY